MARGDVAIAERTAALPSDVAAPAGLALAQPVEQDKVLPLPSWLVKVYFIFPVVLYVPDAIFNYYVYSTGITSPDHNPVVQWALVALWAFLSIGVVGMAYLLSVLAPWHWGQGHHIQALFCGIGVLIATGITTWNSLAYRSHEQSQFAIFKTDEWMGGLWPQLAQHNISLTMILVAVAPPFWGLFWAIVQPTQTGRSLRQIQESHAQRLLRMQQEAELKRLKAETNARIREAQLRGMAQTAAAAREQAKALLTQNRTDASGKDGDAASKRDGSESDVTIVEATAERNGQSSDPLGLPPFTPSRPRELVSTRGGAPEMMNHAAAATPSVRSAPTGTANPASQPMLFNADVHGAAGAPASDAAPLPFRRPPTLGGMSSVLEMSDADAMTGTSGPRAAIRRPNTLGSLNQQLNRPTAVEQAMEEAMRELNPDGSRKNVPAREMVARVAEKLNVDEATARTAIRRVQDARRAGR